MPFQQLRNGQHLSDQEFDSIYPFRIQSLSRKHWTPVDVAAKAAGFLCSEDSSILDIGSGAGKFCLISAALHPESSFTGIDLRPDLIRLCNKLKQANELSNLSFVHQDIKKTDLSVYTGFYFFNSFQENIDETANMDKSSLLSYDAYKSYVKHLFGQFQQLPVGIKLATYHTSELYIPKSFTLVGSHFEDKLKLYIKSGKELDEVLEDRVIEEHILMYGS